MEEPTPVTAPPAFESENTTKPTLSHEHFGLRRLPLVPRRVRILPNLPRAMSKVNPALVEALKRLVGGELRWPLFLHGPAGTGKSSAVLATCDYMLTACYSTVDEACDAEMANDKGPAQVFWSAVREKHLAVLDEVGARATVGDLHFSVVKKFADLRELYAQRAAIYVSNVAPRSITSIYDDRIASRLLAGTVFHLDGADRRCSR